MNMHDMAVYANNVVPFVDIQVNRHQEISCIDFSDAEASLLIE